MKQIRLWLLAVILISCGVMSGYAQELKGEAGKWLFVGELTNPEDTLWVLPTDNLKELNEVVKENGAFKFTTELTKAKEYFLVTPSMVRNTGGFSLIVTAVPGEVLKVKGFCEIDKPANGLTFSGTNFYQHYTEAYILQDKIKESASAQPAIDFIKSHPGSETSTVLIGSVGYYAPNHLDEVVALLPSEIRNGRLKSYIDQTIDDAKEYVRQQELNGKMLPMGSMAPDFTLNDLNGKPLTLSSLQGKFVVLDFWGSWCGWCIKGFPEMKAYYEKYKDKMEILGMDCNDTEARWKKAVADNELPWKHVYVPRNSKVPNDYLISAFPTKVIISPEGKVLLTIIGEDSRFYGILDEMFKED